MSVWDKKLVVVAPIAYMPYKAPPPSFSHLPFRSAANPSWMCELLLFAIVLQSHMKHAVLDFRPSSTLKPAFLSNLFGSSFSR